MSNSLDSLTYCYCSKRPKGFFYMKGQEASLYGNYVQTSEKNSAVPILGYTYINSETSNLLLNFFRPGTSYGNRETTSIIN